MSEAAPPPPPPPPPSSSATAACLSAIVPYPALLQHEESLSVRAGGDALGAYDVAAWTSYLEAADDVLDALNDASRSLRAGAGGGGSSHVARTTALEAGGRTFRVSPASAPGITHTVTEFEGEVRRLAAARIAVGERAVSLLPGSYKLWKNHLLFCTGLLERPPPSGRGQGQGADRVDEQFQKRCDRSRIPPYLLSSSSRHRRYRATRDAYERSLVRLHKMPAIWLHYAAFVAVHDPARDPTAVRRIYDRALVSLPASQHDRVWDDYWAWLTGILPGGGGGGKNDKGGGGGEDWKAIARRGTHKVKYGFESPLVAEWRKRGWGRDHSKSNGNDRGSAGYSPAAPAETALRVLRRHALFDPTSREDLATLCMTRYERYGEAASLLLKLLNNEGGEFASPHGTSRHQLWLWFADVCTAHPGEAETAGVDFDGIVRAVLRGQGVGGEEKGTDGLGFEVFDNTSAAFGAAEDEDGPSRRGKSTPQALTHRLGEMEGTLWTRLAEYHVRAGDFELARSVYEEALDAVTRVRDFSLVFDAYVKFEEGVIEALMELMEEEEEEEEVEDEGDEEGAKGETSKGKGSTANDDEDLDILLGDDAFGPVVPDEEGGADSSADVELAVSRAEHLTSRRPLLLNRVLLRQNPHNVGEWIRRSRLHLDLGEADRAAAALEESLKAVDARKCVNGSSCTLVLTLVDVMENEIKDIDGARSVLERICSKEEYDFADAEDLAQCHAAWVELELRREEWDTALNLARRATSGKVGKKGSRAARGLSRSLRLWNLLFDLEESLGTVQTTKDAYDRALELKVATPSHILNYASFLKDKKYFEESFAAFERGLGLFPFPHAGAVMLWKNYLTEFLERYSGSKTPRARELFDRCLAECPPEESPEFYLLYGEYEEAHGLTKRALRVYERMCASVPLPEKYAAYRLYIAKATQCLGVTSARPIYESAIAALEDGPASRICLEYAKMETGLRETDRARAALVYGAQLADPRRDPDYWKAWHEFEVSHGNEETFREMLRVKRSVAAAFSTVNYNAAEMGGGVPKVDTLTEESALEMIAEREGVEVDARKKPLIGGFVSGKKRTAGAADLGEVERRAARLREATGGDGVGGAAASGALAAAGGGGGDDEIDIDDIDGNEEEKEAPPPPSGMNNIKGVSQKVIPAAVFGGITASGDGDS